MLITAESTPADPNTRTELPPQRVETIERARQEWISKLIDTTRNNNLLFFRTLKIGTLEFTDADPDELALLLRGDAVPVMDLVGGEEEERREEREGGLTEGDGPEAEALEGSELEKRIAMRLRGIQRKAQENLEEKGLETLHLAIGMATWPVEDGGRPPEAPILLIPVTVQARGTQTRGFRLKRTGDIQINPVLLHALDTTFGVRVPGEELLVGVPGVEEAAEEFDPEPIYRQLKESARRIDGFAIEPRVVLGNFSFAKMAMVMDLREHAQQMYENDVIGGVAGDRGSRDAVRPQGPDPDPREFDQAPPSAEYLILDADSSQHQVIAQILAGRNGVIQGPPGTGKSQTIANAIAELTSRKQRILFVAEKRAALEVVYHRLEREGLGHLVLDLHGAGTSRKEVMRKIGDALDAVRHARQVDSDACHRDLAKHRSRLNDHVARLHRPRPATGRSVFELQAAILETPAPARVSSRWRGAALEKLTPAAAQQVVDVLEEASAFEGLLLGTSGSPWAGAVLDDADQVRAAQAEMTTLNQELWPELTARMADARRIASLPTPATFGAIRDQAALLTGAAEIATLYQEEIHRIDLHRLRQALEPATRGGIAAAWAFLTNRTYREARRALLALRKGKAASATLAEEASAALELRSQWQRVSPGATPILVANVSELATLVGKADKAVQRLGAMLGRGGLETLPMGGLEQLLSALDGDQLTPHRLPKLRQLERELDSLGVGHLVSELREKRVPASHWTAAFQHAWYSSALDHAWSEDPDLPAFAGRAHEQYVDQFKLRDRERLKLAAERVRREHAEHVIAVMNQHPEQEDLVRAEARKKTRHLPLRRLLEQAPDVLTALFPCWMASPLSVSQLLDGKRRYFDVALFDEASQVTPEDAIPSLLRAERVVVAGDRHQLPPTQFFADGGPAVADDGEAGGGATEGFESLLDTMDSFLPSWMLEWHYRSRDEALIAFSNRHIYHDRLVTFPGPGRTPAMSHVLVEHVPGQDGQEDSAGREVERVVQLIIQHAEQRPTETLGVIALGIKHARRIQMALDQILPVRPDLEEFFDASRDERFFVKNLERVQGDERDAIILSVGYGKDRAGNLPYRFGPILQNGGERRLNVAVTRARERMTVVSSFSHHDMDPNRSSAKGVEFLRLYLQYAASGGRLLGDEGAAPIPLNGFEADIKDALEAHGIPLIPQYGCSRYRIDLVAQHREHPGRMVLAIECDGATYHSAPTARDRDRLRQQMLEGLGWRFHRIWSTDWFMRREEEITRAVEAYEAAVEHADALAAGEAAPVEAPTPPTEQPAVRPAVEHSPRGDRPAIPLRKSITEYDRQELCRLIRWINSDGQLRSDDQLITEVMQELQFRRRGSRIIDAIQAAIESCR